MLLLGCFGSDLIDHGVVIVDIHKAFIEIQLVVVLVNLQQRFFY